MLDALAWLEWRRIRQPAFLGCAIGLGAPLVLVALAGEGRSSWPGFLRFSAADVTETFLPAFFLVFFWPLWALVVPIHQLDADRREGTRRFLLDRPVPRWRTWILRHAVALAAIVASVGASIAGWAVAGRITGAGSPLGAFLVETPPLPILLLPVCVLLLAFAAGSTLAALGGRSFPAVFLGGLLVLGVAIALVVGMDVQSGAGLRVVDLFLFLLALLLLAASFVAEATGEPAGRHRLRRALVVLVGIPLLCGLAWAGSLWYGHRVRLRQAFVPGFPAPEWVRGDLALLGTLEDGSAAWIVDPATGKRLRYLDDAIAAAWSPDGDSLAILSREGFIRPRFRAAILDGATGQELRSTTLDAEVPDFYFWGLRWHDGYLYVSVGHDNESVLFEIDPETMAVRAIGVSGGCPVKLVPAGPGRLRVAAVATSETVDEDDPDSSEKTYEFIVAELNVASGNLVGQAMERPDPWADSFPWWRTWKLSYSNEWVFDLQYERADGEPQAEADADGTGEDAEDVPVLVAERTADHYQVRLRPEHDPESITWLPDDTLAWIESSEEKGTVRLVTWTPQSGARGSVPFPADPAEQILLRPSPSGDVVLVVSRSRGQDLHTHTVTGAWLWTRATGELRQVDFGDAARAKLEMVNWVTPFHLGCTLTDESIAFFDLEHPDSGLVPLEP